MRKKSRIQEINDVKQQYDQKIQELKNKHQEEKTALEVRLAETVGEQKGEVKKWKELYEQEKKDKEAALQEYQELMQQVNLAKSHFSSIGTSNKKRRFSEI